MPDFTQAPVSTTTSAPRPLSFLTVSGVAATRGSAASTSAGTAIFIDATRGSSRTAGGGVSGGVSDQEISHQAQQDDEETDHPFGERDEILVGPFVLGIVVAVSRRVFDLTVVGHIWNLHLQCWVRGLPHL